MSTDRISADIDKLVADIHEAHYVHGFKFSENGMRLLDELRRVWGGNHPNHDPEKSARLRAEYVARGSKIEPSEVHGDMFNDRIIALTRDARKVK